MADRRPIRTLGPEHERFWEGCAQGGLRPGDLGGVGNHGPALTPGEVLFDADGEARLKRAVDTVAPASLVRVAVMRIEHRPVVVQQIERRCLRG